MNKILGRLLTGLIVLLVLVIGWRLVSWNSDSTWLKGGNFNLIVQDHDFYLYSFHPQDQVLNVIKLPAGLFIPTALGYGEYQLEKIPRLGEMQGVGGGRLLSKSLQNYFLIPIDGYIVRSDLGAKSIDRPERTALAKGKFFRLLPRLITRKWQTNVSLANLLELAVNGKGLTVNQVNQVDLKETNLFKEETLPDQTLVWKLEGLRLDEFVQQYFVDQAVVKEDLRITVLNATSHPKLAERVSRMIKNIGGQVILNEDADQQRPQSAIFYPQPSVKNSYTAKKISQVLEIGELASREGLVGDLTIVIGEDFWQNFY